MKRFLLFLPVFWFVMVGTVYAAFSSGSTGADGAFNPTASIAVQLPASGIFNYTTVNIPTGVTVTYIKNAANTPVTILTTGDILISGSINVSGSNGNVYTAPVVGGKGGPGGYDGGWSKNGLPGSNGLGPGGGGGGPSATNVFGGGGGYGAAGSVYGGCNSGNGACGSAYGNAALQPLIGGSGGGGCYGMGTAAGGGGGGGGAILIASSGTITIGGNITASGGSSYNYSGTNSGGGSGGSIRLVANTIAGSGYLSVNPGNYGGIGRVRLEAYNITMTTPFSTGVVSFPCPQPQPLFLTNLPSLSVTSIAGVNVPTNPTGSYQIPDVWLPSGTTNPVTVAISASNIPSGTAVTVSVAPMSGATSTVSTTLSGTNQTSSATASVTLPVGNYASVIMLQTSYAIQTAMYWEGEKVELVKVMATMGKGSEAVYITESGKEIKAEMIAALMR